MWNFIYMPVMSSDLCPWLLHLRSMHKNCILPLENCDFIAVWLTLCASWLHDSMTDFQLTSYSPLQWSRRKKSQKSILTLLHFGWHGSACTGAVRQPASSTIQWVCCPTKEHFLHKWPRIYIQYDNRFVDFCSILFLCHIVKWTRPTAVWIVGTQ